MPKDNFVRRPIPVNKDPPFVCIKIQLPDDEEYMQAFIGQMAQLALWTQYDRTGDNQGKQVADVWRRVMETITPCFKECEGDCEGDCDCDDCEDCT